jgi:hypothetical protein
MASLLDDLAKKAQAHKLVPFIGAGASMGHVKVDWDGISKLMAARIPSGATGDNIAIAEEFAKLYGNEGLAELLAEHLIIDAFDDSKGATPLQILALELRSLYTTNQDNVIELAAESVGRPLVVAATLEEVSAVEPGDRILYKFHGSLAHPETIVFTASQYDNRIADRDHYMSIRLRSDLLSKSILFVGYSFRDPNIRELFAEMRAKFPTALPGSYFVDFRPSADMAALCREYDLVYIRPADHIPSPTGNPAQDLEMFLRALCERAYGLASQASLDDILTPRAPVARRSAIRHQIDALVAAAKTSDTKTALAVFRGACDDAEIPVSLRASVSEALTEIVRKAGPSDVRQIHAALFNLRVPPAAIFDAVAEFIALANRTPAPSGIEFPLHRPPETLWPPELLPFAAAQAIEVLEQRGEPMNDGFYSRASTWFDGYWMAMPDDQKARIRVIVARAWGQRHTTFENPVDRAERLAKLGTRRAFDVPSFKGIRSDLLAMLPKSFRTPRE